MAGASGTSITKCLLSTECDVFGDDATGPGLGTRDGTDRERQQPQHRMISAAAKRDDGNCLVILEASLKQHSLSLQEDAGEHALGKAQGAPDSGGRAAGTVTCSGRLRADPGVSGGAATSEARDFRKSLQFLGPREA